MRYLYKTLVMLFSSGMIFFVGGAIGAYYINQFDDVWVTAYFLLWIAVWLFVPWFLFAKLFNPTQEQLEIERQKKKERRDEAFEKKRQYEAERHARWIEKQTLLEQAKRVQVAETKQHTTVVQDSIESNNSYATIKKDSKNVQGTIDAIAWIIGALVGFFTLGFFGIFIGAGTAWISSRIFYKLSKD